MSESNGPNGTQGHLGEKEAEEKEEEILILLASHLERELSIVGNLASNNPTLTSLKSQWQGWDWLQILKK